MIIISAESPKNPDQDKARDWFEKRTNNHIRLVQKYCGKIEEYDKKRFKGIVERGHEHDKSKLEAPEREPYILITWRYKCKDDKKDFSGYFGNDQKKINEAEEEMRAASEHHVRNNSHHPEFHTNQGGNLVNKENRDQPPPGVTVDATKMGDLDLAEMVADWCAMSEERSGSPRAWADKNVNVRWKFSDDQKSLIYELINSIWD